MAALGPHETSTRSGPIHRGFTLVELLVCISVIAVLIALTLPALGDARRSAQSTSCLSTLSGLLKGASLFAGDYKGNCPNVFLRKEMVFGENLANFSTATTTTGLAYLGQFSAWQGALIGYIWEEGDPMAAWACPTVARAMGDLTQAHNPAAAGMFSYLYSTALITDARLWDPAAPERRLRSEDREFRRFVGMSDVLHPTRKAMFAEVADHHGREPRLLTDAACARANAAFVDGHAERLLLAGVEPSLEYSFNLAWHSPMRPTTTAVPFNAPAWGCRGVDVNR
ncbi:MAG: prepilin-type N-terminal cleavage/methylation domain-containing protein [Phycisphaerae bacterium]|nr:prepilin-type N-terminal cleavage/methylation domain-containing protein [Phycisphaerae bacterium]